MPQKEEAPNPMSKAAETPADDSPYARRSAKAGQAVVGDFSDPKQKSLARNIQPPEPSDSKTPEVKIPKKTKPKKTRNFTSLKIIVNLVVIAAIAISFWQRQAIIDWYRLRDYQAPVAVIELANDSFMNAYGRKIFYLNKPEVQQKALFYQTCNEGEAVILGCYKPRDGIYLLSVDDKRLDGVEQVTAAHEMLHAAYDRLSYKEKQQIDVLLDKTFKQSSDKELQAKIKLYSDSGADTTNELHSILGTEVNNLPTELENYYKRYFYNRKGIVALSNKYHAEFTKRKERVDKLDQQLAAIEKQVKVNNARLETTEDLILAENVRLEKLLAAGNIEDYNKGAISYNQSLVPYNNLLNQTRGLIAQYKTTLNERNRVAAEAQELNKSLDSSINTDATEIR